MCLWKSHVSNVSDCFFGVDLWQIQYVYHVSSAPAPAADAAVAGEEHPAHARLGRHFRGNFPPGTINGRLAPCVAVHAAAVRLEHERRVHQERVCREVRRRRRPGRRRGGGRRRAAPGKRQVVRRRRARRAAVEKAAVADYGRARGVVDGELGIFDDWVERSREGVVERGWADECVVGGDSVRLAVYCALKHRDLVLNSKLHIGIG